LKEFLTIELLGQSFTFEADEDFERAKQVADFLVDEVQRVEASQSSAGSRPNKMAIVVLAALNIANEHVELKRKQAHFCRAMATRADELLQRLKGERLSARI
jgi:cell division protein ZapA (FtsZ GTPase activity inhibitor)